MDITHRSNYLVRMYSIAEIKIRARAWLLDYRYADFSAEQHKAMVQKAADAVGPAIHAGEETLRLVARSVAHYRAQSELRPKKSLLVTELMSCALLPMGLARWFVEGKLASVTKNSRVKGVRWNQSAFRYQCTPGLFHTPPELAADAPQTVFVSSRYLRTDDLHFLWQVARLAWPLLPTLRIQWIFKIAKEIAFARPLIDAYPADYALIDAECNCALSVLTLYSHRHGQKLYDVEHGDLLISASNSLFETDRCYLWDEFYVDVLKQLQVRSDFRVYTNPTFVLSEAEKTIPQNGIGVFMPGGLTMPDDATKQAFANALNMLAEHRKVRLRPHPAYLHECMAIAPLLSPKVEITDSRAENSKQFILRHEVIVGSVTAALLESIMLGRPTVCFASKYLEDAAGYHYAYRKPNCHTCELSELVDTALKLMQGQPAYAVGS